MFHMLTCFDLKPDVEIGAFRAAYSDFVAYMRSIDLVERSGPIGRRQSDTKMDTDGERDHAYFVIMTFRSSLGASTPSPWSRLLLNPKVHFVPLPFNGDIFDRYFSCNTEPPPNSSHALTLAWLESPGLALGQLLDVAQVFLGDLSCLTGSGL